MSLLTAIITAIGIGIGHAVAFVCAVYFMGPRLQKKLSKWVHGDDVCRHCGAVKEQADAGHEV